MALPMVRMALDHLLPGGGPQALAHLRTSGSSASTGSMSIIGRAHREPRHLVPVEARGCLLARDEEAIDTSLERARNGSKDTSSSVHSSIRALLWHRLPRPPWGAVSESGRLRQRAAGPRRGATACPCCLRSDGYAAVYRRDSRGASTAAGLSRGGSLRDLRPIARAGPRSPGLA